MKIRLFQSYQGDCLLIEAASGHRMLCDGGTGAAMRDFVAPSLERLARDGAMLDLVYVSHIDDDHLGGVLAMLEAALQWKVYDYHAERGDPPAKPEARRVPRIGALWHNAFHDQIGTNAGPIHTLLAANARALRASHVEPLERLGHEYARIANSVPQALRVSRLVKADLLDIALNGPLGDTAETGVAPAAASAGKLIVARPDAPVQSLGSLRIRVLGPTAAELKRLREGWNNWLRDPANRLRAQAIRDRYASGLLAMAGGRADDPFDLREWEGTPSYRGVTTPNIASLILLVEEDDRRVLLTGDAHPDMILAGLKQAELLRDGALHVDVLKVQHHGSENNMSPAFCRTVSADHYLFCGNGAHTNPELTVLDALLASRVGPAAQRARTPEAESRPFTFWFNTTAAAQTQQSHIAHMEQVQRWAEAALRKHGPRLRVRFVEGAYASLTLR
ncbi:MULTISPECIES: MBL fold metallo-hydrolase [unclassified Cupriavidus]|uniref:MBL fold metallo-hydrolase n=1 Tax=unclassified Cupriavidus TaxID=2640874 RepID=UPI0003BE915E|nr:MULTISPECIES: MBL fold metallo-hydrolase [unclassified Cupriavidus]ESH85998.1 hypothetical protein B551_0225335 [Cupriavidus sp. HPC(L)]MCD9120063.1 MBL fold metallo-hydrolase [Cupriavidus sp. UGS-1]